MSIVVTTIPSQPIENESFFTNYSEINNAPVSLNTYVLQNTSNNNVSNTFTVPQYGIYSGPIINNLQSCSYLIKDSNNNFYFTDNQSFFVAPSSTGNYNVYKATVNPNTVTVFISYTTEPELINSNPIGLAIDSQGYFYVALQTGNKIKRYNSDGTGGTNFITSGLNGPCGLVFDTSGNLYVANRFNNNVLKYNSSGSLLTTITSVGNFNEPCAIAFNNIGELFVANVNDNIFQISLPSNTVTLINSLSGRQSVNIVFDIDNNIYLPDFDNVLIQKLTYGSWSSSIIPLYGGFGGYRIGGIIMNMFGDIVMIITNSGANKLQVDQLFLTYWFNNVNLPAGYIPLKLVNITGVPTTIAEFTVYVKGTTPGPNPEPGTICFKEGTKILCKLNGQDVYIPIEYIEEGTLVKTYKNGYKKCKFNMKELLNNKKEHSINNLYRLSKLTNSNLFEDLYITGSHSMLYDNLTEKEEDAMYKLLATYNTKFDIEIPNKIEDKYKLIAYYDSEFTEVKQDININIYHLVLESDNKNRNYGIWANGALTESIDEITLFYHLKNSHIKLINIAKQNNKILDNVFLSKGNMNITETIKPLGNKHMNKLTKFK
jgi:hypothetical protein